MSQSDTMNFNFNLALSQHHLQALHYGRLGFASICVSFDWKHQTTNTTSCASRDATIISVKQAWFGTCLLKLLSGISVRLDHRMSNKERKQYGEAPALFETVAQKVFCPQKFAIGQILTAKFLNGWLMETSILQSNSKCHPQYTWQSLWICLM